MVSENQKFLFGINFTLSWLSSVQGGDLLDCIGRSSGLSLEHLQGSVPGYTET